MTTEQRRPDTLENHTKKESEDAKNRSKRAVDKALKDFDKVYRPTDEERNQTL